MNTEHFKCRLAQRKRACIDSPAVNGSRSLDAMCPNISFHPLSAPREAMSSADPRLKVIANLEGVRMIMGRKMKKARRRKTAPLPASAAKYTHWVVPGTLQQKTRIRRSHLHNN